MIEKGRYKKPKKLEVKDRICTHCNDAQIEDEMHFMMHCNLYHKKRKLMIDSVNEVIPTFSDLNKSEQFTVLMSGFNGDSEISNIVVNYILISNELRKNNEICQD
jgi:hypothetical protein